MANYVSYVAVINLWMVAILFLKSSFRNHSNTQRHNARLRPQGYMLKSYLPQNQSLASRIRPAIGLQGKKFEQIRGIYENWR